MTNFIFLWNRFFDTLNYRFKLHLITSYARNSSRLSTWKLRETDSKYTINWRGNLLLYSSLYYYASHYISTQHFCFAWFHWLFIIRSEPVSCSESQKRRWVPSCTEILFLFQPRRIPLMTELQLKQYNPRSSSSKLLLLLVRLSPTVTWVRRFEAARSDTIIDSSRSHFPLSKPIYCWSIDTFEILLNLIKIKQ